MKERLLDDFAPVTKAEWKDKIVADLKGKPYESLLWENEGLKGGPIYTEEDLKSLSNFKSFQNNCTSTEPEIYGPKHWTNYQLIIVENESQANEEALSALSLGADGLIFQVAANPNFRSLLKEIQTAYCAISFELVGQNSGFIKSYFDYLNSEGHDLQKTNGFISSNHSLSKEEIEITGHAQNIRCINIGLQDEFISVNVVQELALLLFNATSAISNYQDMGIQVEKLCSTTQFQVRFGKNYFIEIAKIRALRLLVQSLWKGFGLDLNPDQVRIFSSSNEWGAPTEDKYNHLIGATTSAMSAIIGGCNDLLIRPFNSTFEKQATLASRSARNISSILKEESYLDRMVDPAAGSYFIESITNQIIENVWDLFLKLEKSSDQNEITMSGLNTLSSSNN